MAKNRIEFKLATRENNNKKSVGYHKHYLVPAESSTLSQRGFIDHMTAHGLSVPRALIEAVLSQISQCIPELCAEGTGVKVDGLGIFYPTVKSTGANSAKEASVAENLQGVRVRFRPDSTKLDNITSRVFKEKVSPAIVGQVQKVTIDGVTRRAIIPFDTTITEVTPEP